VATLTQDNFAFSPAKLTVKSGSTITLTDANAATSHNFTIDGQGVNVTNAPGQSQEVTLNLQPGTYPFFCSFHVAQGMKGTLTVT
jgi:plastocyanin